MKFLHSEDKSNFIQRRRKEIVRDKLITEKYGRPYGELPPEERIIVDIDPEIRVKTNILKDIDPEATVRSEIEANLNPFIKKKKRKDEDFFDF